MKNIPFYIYSFAIFLCILDGTEAWFMWHIQERLFTIFLIFGVIFYQVTNPKSFNYRLSLNIKKAFIILFIVFLSLSVASNGGYVRVLTNAYILFSIFCLRINLLHKLFEIVKLYIVILLLPSLFIHLLLQFYPLPPIGIIEHPASVSYIFSNYIFLVKNDILYSERFCAFTLEPGYIASFCAYLLYSDKFRMNKFDNIVFLISIIVSLSLAGYCLAALGFFLCKIKNIKTIFIRLVQTFLIVLSLYIVAQYYNDGNNYINEKIFERLELDDEKGIKGNNRVSDDVNDYYNQFLNSSNVLWGYSINKMNKLKNSLYIWNSAGYKPFLMQYGIVRLILILLFYYLIARNTNNKYYSMGYFFIIVLYFTATGYVFSMMWLILYLTGIRINSYNKMEMIEVDKVSKELPLRI